MIKKGREGRGKEQDERKERKGKRWEEEQEWYKESYFPIILQIKGYGLFIILFKSTFSLQYGHVCFLPTMHHPRMQNSWNLSDGAS